MAGGIVNLVLASAGLLFFGQLVRRRKIHRDNYRYTRKEPLQSERNLAGERKLPAAKVK
jgi:hypothetical protein